MSHGPQHLVRQCMTNSLKAVDCVTHHNRMYVPPDPAYDPPIPYLGCTGDSVRYDEPR
jgi:hypothetical protein